MLGLLSGNAAAQAPGAGAKPSAAASLSSLVTLAQRTAELQVDAPLVVWGPLELAPDDLLPAASRARLLERLQQVVGSAVAHARARLDAPLSLTQARAQARARGHSLLYFSAQLRNTELLLSVDWIVWPSSFWQRLRQPEGTVVQQHSWSVPLDAELRRFFPSPPSLWTQISSHPAPVSDVVALACSSTPDEGTSLVFVGRRELARGRYQNGQLVLLAKTHWNQLSPLSPTPLRAPLSRALQKNSTYLVGLSDRAHLVALDLNLKLKKQQPRALPLSPSTCGTLSSTGLSSSFFACDAPPRPTSPPDDTESYNFWTQTAARDAQGTDWQAQLYQKTHADETWLQLRSSQGEQHSVRLPEVGSLGELADLRGDGSLAVLHSSSEPSPTEDRLTVLVWDGEQLQKRWEKSFPALTALSVCPFEGKNPPPLVLASSSHIWVLR